MLRLWHHLDMLLYHGVTSDIIQYLKYPRNLFSISKQHRVVCVWQLFIECFFWFSHKWKLLIHQVPVNASNSPCRRWNRLVFWPEKHKVPLLGNSIKLHSRLPLMAGRQCRAIVLSVQRSQRKITHMNYLFRGTKHWNESEVSGSYCSRTSRDNGFRRIVLDLCVRTFCSTKTLQNISRDHWRWV